MHACVLRPKPNFFSLNSIKSFCDVRRKANERKIEIETQAKNRSKSELSYASNYARAKLKIRSAFIVSGLETISNEIS